MKYLVGLYLAGYLAELYVVDLLVRLCLMGVVGSYLMG